jgi:hypothetical protein
MPRTQRFVTVAVTSLIVVACSDAPRSTSPSVTPGDAALSSIAGGSERVVSMLDACDPTTFNAVLGEGGCTRRGGVTFQDFLAQLQNHGTVGSWRFAPSEMNVAVGQTLVAINRGGEEHTFTEVEEFGGGVVDALNALSGNLVKAPECLASPERVPPGGVQREVVDESGTELYQCCIHPWMRVVVHANRGS